MFASDPVTTLSGVSVSSESPEIFEAQPSQIDQVFVKIVDERPKVRRKRMEHVKFLFVFQADGSKSRNQIYAPKFCLKLRRCLCL